MLLSVAVVQLKSLSPHVRKQDLKVARSFLCGVLNFMNSPALILFYCIKCIIVLNEGLYLCAPDCTVLQLGAWGKSAQPHRLQQTTMFSLTKAILLQGGSLFHLL